MDLNKCLRQMLVCAFVGLCAHLNVSAQIKLSVQCPDTVSVGESFEVKYVVEGKKSFDPQPMNVNDESVQVIGGPSVSSQTTVAIVNGKMETRQSVYFKYWLSCTKPGTFRVPVLSIADRIGNEMHFPDDLTFFVRESESVQKGQRGKAKCKKTNLAKDSFADCVLVVDKDKISLGDSVRCSVYLYSDMDLKPNYASNYSFGADNAIKHEIVADSDSASLYTHTTFYKGREARSVLLQEFYLIPLQAGRLKIVGQADCTFLYSDKDEDNLVESFFNGGRYTRVDSTLRIKPVCITVTPQKSNSGMDKVGMSSDGRGFCMVVDRSSSLYAKEDTLKMDYYKMENAFLEKFRKNYGEDYETIVFAGHPYRLRKGEWNAYIDSISDSSNDGSAVYDAVLSAAIASGENSEVLLLTDGSDNSSRISANTLKNLLLMNKIRLNVVAFASKNDSVYCVGRDSVDVNEDGVYDEVRLENMYVKNSQKLDEVRDVAEATGGLFVQVCNEEQIQEAAQQMSNYVSCGERPAKKPVKGFCPAPSLLHRLHKEISDISKVPL